MNELWWTAVPNPVGLIRTIADLVQNGENAAYVIPQNLEWQSIFHDEIAERCRDSRRTFRVIHADQRTDKSPGELLLTELVTHPTLREGYRSSIGYAKYLASSDSVSGLGGQCLYIRNASGSTLQDWCSFIADYCKAHKDGNPACQFLIECIDTRPDICAGLKQVDYHAHIKDYDISIFCILSSSYLDMPPLLRSYTAELACLSCCGDPEAAAMLIGCGAEFVQDPAVVIAEVASRGVRTNGAAFCIPEKMQELIWKAQIRIFFPLIEEYRMYLIRTYEQEIPFHETITGTFGQTITDIWDIDLGTFKLLCDCKRMHLPPAEYEKMCRYRDCRNSLAHNTPLSYEQLHLLVDDNT